MSHLVRKGFAALAVIAVTACSSNFSGNGTQTAGAPVPPVQPQAVTAPQMPQVPKKAGDARDREANGDTVTLPFSQAPSGLQCPQQQGYTCELAFNMPSPSPSPGKGDHAAAKHAAKHEASPSPSPSASPSPSPSPTASPSPDASGSPSASRSPNASASPSEPQITLQLVATPDDAPAMNGADDKKPSTALVAVRMSVNADEVIVGRGQADFTLPSDQITKGRGFAIQLFHETTGKHNKRTDKFVGSYSDFDANAKTNTLHFSFDSPPLQVKKNETWLFVLYADKLATPSPNASPTDNASPSPTPSS
jgi:hypothetical protein